MPRQPVVSTRFVLQRSELATAQSLAARSLPTSFQWLGWVQFGLLMLLVVIVCAASDFPKRLQPLPLITLVIVSLVFLTGGLSGLVLRRVQFSRMEGQEIWYEFDEAGVNSGMPGSESRQEWSMFTKVSETTDLFVILGRGTLLYTIPKRALAGEQVTQLRDLLTQKVPPRKG